jgi:hypothetical protein
MINKSDHVVLNFNIPKHKLKKGDVGLVIFIHDGGKFEVEFSNIIGEKITVIKLLSSQIKKIHKIKIHQIRNFNLN